MSFSVDGALKEYGYFFPFWVDHVASLPTVSFPAEFMVTADPFIGTDFSVGRGVVSGVLTTATTGAVVGAGISVFGGPRYVFPAGIMVCDVF